MQIEFLNLQKITTEQLLFLSSLIQYLNASGTIEISEPDDVVVLNLKLKNGNVISSIFALSVIDQYLNHVSKFVDEIL